MADEVKAKWFLTSKTIWANAILGIAAFYGPAKEIVTPEVIDGLFVAVNLILRFVTHKMIYIS